MRYALLHYRVPLRLEEAVGEALAAVGFSGFSLTTRTDGDLDATLYGEHGAVPPAAVAALAALGLQPTGSEVAEERALLANVLPDEPCELVDGVWIDPCATLRETPERMVLRVPIGPAFGDGRHPSTRAAARFLREVAPRGARVLDLGCGTGVLGLYARRLGAASVDFTDIDEGALRTTRAACAAEGCADARVFASDLLAAVDGAYDVVLANIYADLLLLVATDAKLDAVLPRGALILAGIAEPRGDEVVAAFAARGFTLRDRTGDGWWTALSMAR